MSARRELARVPLAQLAEGRPLRVAHPPFDIVIVRAGDAIHALEDACPHSGASLSEGCVRGGALVCRAHGWEVDLRSGDVLTAVGRGRRNHVYAVERRGAEVVVLAPAEPPEP